VPDILYEVVVTKTVTVLTMAASEGAARDAALAFTGGAHVEKPTMAASIVSSIEHARVLD
jgi:hypothetical protein